ncbi:SDR family oxidoreductase [Sphingobium sp.]|uniref:SDR family oxidoreductase n=1 Tax=Sphingobium sp. TaxID=1912891 RepID=UPI0028BF064A|nr:NmrA family NAD(P)-binding protein [Sphingobium sp.]
MLLLTAANGNQGRLLAPKLLRAGFVLRACTRTEESAAALRASGVHDVIVGDIAEPDVLARAIDGVDQIYHIGPSAHPREREMGFRMVDAARAAGVGHFVFSSVLHAITTDLVQHEIKRDIEEHLLSSRLEFTILQPANYMAPWRMQPTFRDGVFRLSWSLDRRQSMVDIGDITDVALLVLKERERHYGATYELCGEGRFTGHDMGAILTQVAGRPIAVEEIGADDYLTALFGDGDRSQFTHQINVLRGISARYSSHDFVGNPNVLTWLLGRPLTSFEQFARTQFAIFQQDAQARQA